MRATLTRWEFVSLAVILGAGLAVRMGATALAYYPTLDTGTVGLMACHILDGARPLYFYGQGYMGALEAYVAAGLAGILGPSALVMNLAPSLFALGWAAVLWGVVRALYGPASGLATAALVAVPPWHILWYSMATYGGYPEAWMLGAGAMAAALYIVSSPGPAPLGFAALGLCTGVGFWINPQSLMYAGVGWAVVGPQVLIRRRQSLHWLLLAAVCAAAFVLPALSAAGESAHPKLVSWSLDPADWTRRFREFVLAGLRSLIFSREPVAPWWTVLVWTTVAAATLSATAAVAQAKSRAERMLRCAPLAVVAVSLVLSLPHSMADERAPRYLIPLWTGLACWLFAMPIAMPVRWIAVTSRVALGGWLLAQGISITDQIRERHPNQVTAYQLRDQLVETSIALGNPPVYLVGNEIFGHYGQPWNFHGQGKTRFVSSFDERCFATQAEAESSKTYALGCKPGVAEKTASTLDALSATYQTTPTDALTFFHDIEVPVHPQVAVHPAAAVWEHDQTSAADALDRRAESTIAWPKDGVLRIEFASPVEVSGVLLCSPGRVGEDLPETLQVSVSADGSTFRPHAESTGPIHPAYRAGDRAYLKGYRPAMELAWDPVVVRALHIRAGSPRTITLNELFVFARDTEPADSTFPVAWCRERMDALGLRFVFADRRQSARLRGGSPTASPAGALPPYNPKNPASLISRKFLPAADIGILVERRFADDAARTLQQLYGPSIIATRETLGGYRLLGLRPPPPNHPPLLWNGFTVLAHTPGS